MINNMFEMFQAMFQKVVGYDPNDVKNVQKMLGEALEEVAQLANDKSEIMEKVAGLTTDNSELLEKITEMTADKSDMIEAVGEFSEIAADSDKIMIGIAVCAGIATLIALTYIALHIHSKKGATQSPPTVLNNHNSAPVNSNNINLST